jgi:hypothetical protein
VVSFVCKGAAAELIEELISVCGDVEETDCGSGVEAEVDTSACCDVVAVVVVKNWDVIAVNVVNGIDCDETVGREISMVGIVDVRVLLGH